MIYYPLGIQVPVVGSAMTHEDSWEARWCMVGATLAVALAVCVKHTVELLVPPEPM